MDQATFIFALGVCYSSGIFSFFVFWALFKFYPHQFKCGDMVKTAVGGRTGIIVRHLYHEMYMVRFYEGGAISDRFFDIQMNNFELERMK